MKWTLRNCFYCFIILCLAAGCTKKENSLSFDTENGASGEDIQIQQYLFNHNIQARKDPSGLYYQIIRYGDSTHRITLENVPYMIYTRRLLNGTFIDASIGVTDFDGRKLKDHIAGWQIGLQKITKGGKILMIIPSNLGFGNVSLNNIPANSILVCEAELVDFK
jgi:FKBP-type peptidyl-prolyl cis-trans isomerase